VRCVVCGVWRAVGTVRRAVRGAQRALCEPDRAENVRTSTTPLFKDTADQIQSLPNQDTKSTQSN